MASRKRPKRRPRPNHSKKGQKSQHDKRERLLHPNPRRQGTTAARVPLTQTVLGIVQSLCACVDKRWAFRLEIIFSGMLLANDRRTASAWFAAAGVRDDWDRFYDCLRSIGRSRKRVSTGLLRLILKWFGHLNQDRIVLAMDDSPTARYGRHVEGAGVHHNPTPGPADGDWVYGHNWVTLAWLATHPQFSIIALPLMSMLYVRKVDVPKLKQKYDWQFKTKHELGIEMMTWFMQTLRAVGIQVPVWLAVDGAYAVRPFLLPLLSMGVTVASRLRVDARLYDLPPSSSGKRGRPRKYGYCRISLAKRAGHPNGWQSITYKCRGVEVTRQCKTFLATSPLVGDAIRVVIVRFESGTWAPYFCTDTTADARQILETIAARWAIEEQFHDVKEVYGGGQQQVRNVFSNIACWNMNQWLYTIVELCSWNETAEVLTDRSDRPWDNPSRRPSHADRRRRIVREMLHEQFNVALPDDQNRDKLQSLINDLISLAA
jgi:hypothetical protein